MILEAFMLKVKEGMEEAFRGATEIISSMKGYVFQELQRCMGVEGKYLLQVQWETLEDHTIGFIQSKEYQEWKKKLHKFCDPFPTDEYFEKVQL